MRDQHPFIPYGRQDINDADIEAVVQVLRGDYLTQGPCIDRFEHALADFCGARHAVVFSSGTAALHAAYAACGLSAGDELITSANTFVATANAAAYLGATPRFADIDPHTGLTTPAQCATRITPRTRAIVPVHYAGHPADMDGFRALAQAHGLVLIDDACHAIGARYRNQRLGNGQLADMSIFSFHPVKHIATGEGGAVLTNNTDYHEQLLRFRSHGIVKTPAMTAAHGPWYYEMQSLGYNYRMTDIQAALGHSQLQRLPDFLDRRQHIAARYQAAWHDNPWFDLPSAPAASDSAWHLYPIRLKAEQRPCKRQRFEAMHAAGLGVQTHYIPLPAQPWYNNKNQDHCPHAQTFYDGEISLPMYPALSDALQDEVIARINRIFASA